MSLGDVVRGAQGASCQTCGGSGFIHAPLKHTRHNNEPCPAPVHLTAQDLEDVQEAWELEAEHQARFYGGDRCRRPAMSAGAESLKAALDGVLYKHHPPGLSIYDEDRGDEP